MRRAPTVTIPLSPTTSPDAPSNHLSIFVVNEQMATESFDLNLLNAGLSLINDDKAHLGWQ